MQQTRITQNLRTHQFIVFYTETSRTQKHMVSQRDLEQNNSLSHKVLTCHLKVPESTMIVQHVDLSQGVPPDVESYLQETGRAGRDGKPAIASLFYSGTDFSGSQVGCRMREYCSLESDKCRRKFLLHEFDEDDGSEVPVIDPCTCCDNCASVCTCVMCSAK